MGAGRIAYIPAPVVVVVVVCAVLHLFLTRTRVGRDIYAIGGNKQAAVLCGIPVNSRLTLVYALSGGLAGLAAIVLAGRMNSGYPLAGAGAELDSIAAVIIGGASFFGGTGLPSFAVAADGDLYVAWGRRTNDHTVAMEVKYSDGDLSW